jgi:hypothetical protein
MQNNHAVHPNLRKRYIFSLKTWFKGQKGQINPSLKLIGLSILNANSLQQSLLLFCLDAKK